MKRYSLLLAMAFGLITSVIGCWNGERQRLLGTWQVEMEMAAGELSQMTPIDNPWVASLGNVLMRSMQMSVQLVFRSDDTCTLSVAALGNTFTRNGSWRVDGSQGDTVRVAILLEGDSEARPWDIQFLDQNSFQTVPPEGSKLSISRLLTFARVPK